MFVKYFALVVMTLVKFLGSFSFGAFALKLSFLETFLITGITSVVCIFTMFFVSDAIARGWYWFVDVTGMRAQWYKWFPSKRKIRKKFTRRNKRIVKIRRGSGLIGVVLLAPILSIPVGSFVTFRIFGKTNRTLIFLIISVSLWCLILSYINCYLHLRMLEM